MHRKRLISMDLKVQQYGSKRAITFPRMDRRDCVWGEKRFLQRIRTPTRGQLSDAAIFSILSATGISLSGHQGLPAWEWLKKEWEQYEFEGTVRWRLARRDHPSNLLSPEQVRTSLIMLAYASDASYGGWDLAPSDHSAYARVVTSQSESLLDEAAAHARGLVDALARCQQLLEVARDLPGYVILTAAGHQTSHSQFRPEEAAQASANLREVESKLVHLREEIARRRRCKMTLPEFVNGPVTECFKALYGREPSRRRDGGPFARFTVAFFHEIGFKISPGTVGGYVKEKRKRHSQVVMNVAVNKRKRTTLP